MALKALGNAVVPRCAEILGRSILAVGVLLVALAWPAVVQSAGLPDVQARYVAALHQRDDGDPVGAWFSLIRVAGDTLPRAQNNPEVHHQLAVIARSIASLSFYFGKAWAADEDTGAWPVCVRFQLGYLYAAEGLVQCTVSGSRRAHRFPWTKLGGVASLLRERLERLGCAVPGPVRLWAAGDP